MYTEINQEIYELKEKLFYKKKLKSLVSKLNEELENKRAESRKLQLQLESEKLDVEKLEGKSFSGVVLSILGKKEERLDKERQEYLTAKLKYDECMSIINDLSAELTNAKSQLRTYQDSDEEYNQKIEEKKKMIINEGGHKGKELRGYLDRINEIKLEMKELREAISAGQRTSDALGRVKDSLEDAKGWGTWDMLGGGFFVNMAKHSAIDQANNYAHDFQRKLKSFMKELEDVDQFIDVNVNLTGFQVFADYFFDGFFVDWFVQSKINDSLDRVIESDGGIKAIINDLSGDLDSLEREIIQKKAQIENILVN